MFMTYFSGFLIVIRWLESFKGNILEKCSSFSDVLANFRAILILLSFKLSNFRNFRACSYPWHYWDPILATTSQQLKWSLQLKYVYRDSLLSIPRKIHRFSLNVFSFKEAFQGFKSLRIVFLWQNNSFFPPPGEIHIVWILIIVRILPQVSPS